MDFEPLRRDVRSSMTLELSGATEFVLTSLPARGVPVQTEQLTVTLDGHPLEMRELGEDPSTRLTLFHALPASGSGTVTIDYCARMIGRAQPAVVCATDPIVFLRPSRYVPSDSLQPFARETFAPLDAASLVRAVSTWVFERLAYVPEASSPTGGAVETLAAGAGVCRDFAHVTAALLRALDVPARLVSVYAPQLVPMDFHAVVEAIVEGRWVVVDSTRLAPRSAMVRMATGRDATDTAFLTNTVNDIRLLRLSVDATASERFEDDPDELVQLG